MSIYKMTTMWNESIMGVSESWYTPDVTPSQLVTLLTKYHSARFACMYDNQYMVGVRLALYGSKRQSTVLIPPLDNINGVVQNVALPLHGALKSGTLTGGPDQLRSVIQTKVQFNDTRQAIRYHSGVSDLITTTEPGGINQGRDPSWWQLFQNFQSFVSQNGLQVRARSITGPNAPASVIGVTSQAAAPSLLGIVLPAATAPPIVQGSQVSLQHFRPAKFTRNATVNGTFTVDSINTTLVPGNLIVYLRGTGTIDPNTVRLTALSTIQLIGYQLYPVQKYTYIRVGIHKRGRPSMSPRGRRLARPTLDP
ncbi:MAG: hypothetical protein ACYC6M_09100 [Terriglobales bacterium]